MRWTPLSAIGVTMRQTDRAVKHRSVNHNLRVPFVPVPVSLREDKRGTINNQLPPILERLSIETKIWIKNATQFEQQHKQQFRRRKTASL